ncbi:MULTISPECIES: IclR family transcriptional regulator [unclassified Streptomyces]|uniref:IclR family transcriptional regulator n=1 Tax=unclassified Streptomyces TaxID=2593676 RepID=UPI002237C3EC|nr:IclR family transcriptional regulator [Streptomyces sp. SHP 1-2]
MEQNKNPNHIEAVDRALVLLTLLAERGQLSVTEAGRELGVVPSTAHRLLSTLLHRGFAVRGENRLYRAGPRLLPLGTSGAPPLPERVRPHLGSLYGAVDETVHLMVRTGSDVLFLDGIEGARSLRVGLRVGLRLPAHRTSGGKAMLADLEREAVDALHPGGPPAAPGGRTGGTAALHDELAAVRCRGYGTNLDESEPGVTAIGASLGVVDGHHAALAIALPTVRALAVGVEELAARLLRTCEEARRELGGRAARPAAYPAAASSIQ